MISVLVPSETDELLDGLLSSMESSEPGSCSRVIVGDHGLSRALMDQWGIRGVGFVPVPNPFVFSQGINLCVSEAPPDHDLLILGDDTTIVTPRWASEIDRFVASDPVGRGFGLVSLLVNGRAANHEQHITAGLPFADLEIRETHWTVCFICPLIPRAIWNELGPLDERYVGVCHEDDDFNLKVWHAGYRTGVCGVVVVNHGAVSAFARTAGQDWEERYNLNARLFQEKWGVQYAERKGLSSADVHFCGMCECWKSGFAP